MQYTATHHHTLQRTNAAHFNTVTVAVTLYCINATMGWLRLIRSIKLQVSFAEYCPFYRALLQKRPLIDPTNQSLPIPCLECNMLQPTTTHYNTVLQHNDTLHL